MTREHYIDNANINFNFNANANANNQSAPYFMPEMDSKGRMMTSMKPQQVGSSSASFSYCRTIGPSNVEGMTSCPCCNREHNKEGRQTVGDFVHTANVPRYASLLDEEPDLDESDRMLPGILSEGVAYTVLSVLVQGWVHKKGTGHDWIGSKAWKPRWAVLASAKVDGYEVNVPLLLIYWYRSSGTPSSVIMLDSTVVLPEDDIDETMWDCHRFKIRPAKTPTEKTENNVTRIFSCPKKGRDLWVYAINQALLKHEKEKGQAKSKIKKRTSYPWIDERFVSGTARPSSPSTTPPNSPRPRGFNLPKPRRKESLLGEAFLVDDFAQTAYE